MLPDLRLIMGATVAIVVVAAIGLTTLVSYRTAYQTSADVSSNRPATRPSADDQRAMARVDADAAQNQSQARLLPTEGHALDESLGEGAAPAAAERPPAALDRLVKPDRAASLEAPKRNADQAPQGQRKVNPTTRQLASAPAHDRAHVHRRHRLASRTQPGYARGLEHEQPGAPRTAARPGVPDNQAKSTFSLFR